MKSSSRASASVCLFLALTGLSFHAWAAKTELNVAAVKALKLPLTDRLKEVEKQGASGREQLETVAFDASSNLETRWRAITTVGRVYHGKAQDFLEKAMKSPEWYVRNAALVVAPYSPREWAVRWSRILLSDEALVVRTAAVEVLRQLGAKETEEILWQKLYSSENYHLGSSLWIRHHIADTLADFAESGDESKFMQILNDRDSTLHPIAMRALKRLTVHDFTTANEWRSWWSKRTQ